MVDGRKNKKKSGKKELDIEETRCRERESVMRNNTDN